MPGGRPSSYDPSYCERVLELGKQGYSVVEMAAEIGVHRNTLETNWPEAHPDFLEAFTQAKQLSQAWWEKQGRMNLLVPPGVGTFQASVWSRSMAARFPADWREATKTELVGKGDGPIKHDHSVALSAETSSLLAGLKAGSSDPGDAAPVQD